MPRKGKRQRGPSGAFSSNNKNDTNINNSTVSDDTDTITMSSITRFGGFFWHNANDIKYI